MIASNIKSKANNLLTKENIEKFVDLAPKYISYYKFIGKLVIRDYIKEIRFIVILFMLIYATQWACNYLQISGNFDMMSHIIKNNKDITIVIVNAVLFLVGFVVGAIKYLGIVIGFLMGYRFMKYITSKPYRPMMNQEYEYLIKNLEKYGLVGTHTEGQISYQWDTVLDTLYNKHLENNQDEEICKLYKTIKKHFYYLSSTEFNKNIR